MKGAIQMVLGTAWQMLYFYLLKNIFYSVHLLTLTWCRFGVVLAGTSRSESTMNRMNSISHAHLYALSTHCYANPYFFFPNAQGGNFLPSSGPNTINICIISQTISFVLLVGFRNGYNTYGLGSVVASALHNTDQEYSIGVVAAAIGRGGWFAKCL